MTLMRTDTGITARDLAEYWQRERLIAEMQYERDSIAGLVESPRIEWDGSARGNAPSSPTERKIRRMQILDDKIARYAAMQDRVDAMVDGIDDPTAHCIIAYRYICGLKWRDVADKSHVTEDAAKKIAQRWIRKNLE